MENLKKAEKTRRLMTSDSSFSGKEEERVLPPPSFWDRLRENLCGLQGLSLETQFHLSKERIGYSAGFLRLTKSSFPSSLEKVMEKVSSFYQDEGYQLIEEEKNTIQAVKEEEHYRIVIIENGQSYAITVSEYIPCGFI